MCVILIPSRAYVYVGFGYRSRLLSSVCSYAGCIVTRWDGIRWNGLFMAQDGMSSDEYG